MALEDENIIGYIVVKEMNYPPVFLYEKFGYIEDIVVKSNYRRKGIGTHLLENALNWFRSRALKRIELNVVKENQSAYSFYVKHGFKDYKHRFLLEIN